MKIKVIALVILSYVFAVRLLILLRFFFLFKNFCGKCEIRKIFYKFLDLKNFFPKRKPQEEVET